MNDFTKDELIELKIVLKEYLDLFTSPESTHQIKDKIKSMIDNYDTEKPYMNITLKDGTKVKCREIMLEDFAGGGGGTGKE